MEYTMFIFLGLALVALFFMSSRGRKQQAKQQEFRNTLNPGDEVMTSSGQLGTVHSVVGETVLIETTPGVVTRWVKAAIQAVPPQFATAESVPAQDDVIDPDDPDRRDRI
ncbi:preprotein translocase subunit YajC [Serinibacter salmoneus]|uniref:Preprotein translocase subunit YajC n=1 Tax=Serinibacter salmoneus TaxID=556530 RepID=A0A2A9D0Y5_9MICO|nr:preprotein translocase subunit YajC [Serinibacter salmoneus]PFG19612.1 preprotein translocase subunit YajC [Serinibacter salmoneus]